MSGTQSGILIHWRTGKCGGSAAWTVPAYHPRRSMTQLWYCWWTKSCTAWYVWNLVNNGINYLSTGAGFCPSTVGHGKAWDLCRFFAGDTRAAGTWWCCKTPCSHSYEWTLYTCAHGLCALLAGAQDQFFDLFGEEGSCLSQHVIAFLAPEASNVLHILSNLSIIYNLFFSFLFILHLFHKRPSCCCCAGEEECGFWRGYPHAPKPFLFRRSWWFWATLQE